MMHISKWVAGFKKTNIFEVEMTTDRILQNKLNSKFDIFRDKFDPLRLYLPNVTVIPCSD